MPMRRRARKSNKSNRPLRRRRVNRRVARARMFNPQPVFTETFRIPGNDPLAPDYQLNSNTGGVLSVRMSDMPQLAQYKTLYTKYRILKATFICLPQFLTTSSDPNAAAYNQTQGASAWGMGRVVTSINDSPDAPVPANESEVLEDNGCKIHVAKSKLTLSCRPVPNTLDANGNQFTMKNKFINFTNILANPEITHYGIRWWYTLPNPGGNTTNIPYFVYVKLTFQLADPR